MPLLAPHLDAVRTHLACQTGMYLSGTCRVPGWLGGWHDRIDDGFWNLVVPIRDPPAVAGLDRIAAAFAGLDRTPVLYGPADHVEAAARALDHPDLDTVYEDVWLAADPAAVEAPAADPAVDVVDVREAGATDAFLDAFRRAYGGDAPDDPYAGLPESYVDALGDGLADPLADRDAHLLARDDGRPVGVGSLVASGDVALLYNAGVVPERRREGVGRRLARLRVTRAAAWGCDRVLLQTEPGSPAHELYDGLGFEVAFRARALGGGGWDGRF